VILKKKETIYWEKYRHVCLLIINQNIQTNYVTEKNCVGITACGHLKSLPTSLKFICLIHIGFVKVRIQLLLRLIKHHTMMMYGGISNILLAFLTSAADERVSG
jgi:hypothetical protein